jgi:flagellar biogenesis protein FliO
MEWIVWLRAISALALVALLLLALYWGLRLLSQGRLVSMGRTRLVSVVESTFVGQNVSVHLMKVAGRYLLVGASSGHVGLISELSPEEVEPLIESQRQALSLQTARLAAVFRRKR